MFAFSIISLVVVITAYGLDMHYEQMRQYEWIA